MFSATLMYSVVGAILLLYLLDAYFSRQRHPQEPLCARSKIPLIGHGLGLAMYGSKYYEIISPGQPEIFTLPIFTLRIYVINSRHLFPVIMRQARTLSFQPFTKIASKVWCDASDHFMDMHEEGHPWIRDIFRDTRTALAAGEALDYQNMLTGRSLQKIIDELDQQVHSAGKKKLALYSWVHHLMSVAPTDGVYGKNNPFRDSKVEKDYWLWAESVKKMTAKIPNFLIRKELQARDRVFDAFEKYLHGDISDAAEVTLLRQRISDREGVSLRDQAKFQASFNIALLGNTVPTAFWSLYEVFSRSQLLQEIRQELEANIVTRDVKTGEDTYVLDVAALRTECPLLLSAYQESQRMRSIHANIRKVMSDTTIESPTSSLQYHFVKDDFIQMPSGPIHKDSQIWGPTVETFDPYRFAKENAVTRKGESYAFMPWGSAPHLCPARQFASTEVMLFIALMVLRFDFAPGDGGKDFKEPKILTGEMTTMMPTKDEFYVNLRRRDGWHGRWQLKMGDSSKRIPLASG